MGIGEWGLGCRKPSTVIPSEPKAREGDPCPARTAGLDPLPLRPGSSPGLRPGMTVEHVLRPTPHSPLPIRHSPLAIRHSPTSPRHPARPLLRRCPEDFAMDKFTVL